MTDPMQTDNINAAFEHQAVGVIERRCSFDLAARKHSLTRLADVIRKNEGAIVAAIAQDFGKCATETILTEILPVLQEISHARRHLKRWMRPKHATPTLASFGTSGKVRPEARGVCLIIAPWNYPFNLAFGPLVSCLAAGNAAIIKPSEMAPATSALVASLVAETFPPELVTVIEGAVDTSTALLALPFDHIFFTGSPAVGKIVMAAAAKSLASVTLELGGKSPTIIGPDANLKRAADWIAFGKFSNAGQTCIAPDHLFVHASIKDTFVAILRDIIAKAYGKSGTSPDLARVENSHHADRIAGLLDDAIQKGAQVTLGGARDGTYIAPTLIETVTPQMDIDHEEIFGPVLPIMPFDDLGTVIAQINARPKPLSLYIFDKNKSRVDRIIAQTSSGHVGVNLTMLQFSHANLPFGGVNHSGIGNAHGHYGFRTFSNERAVLTNYFSPIFLFFPPYTARVKRILRLAKRVLG